MNKDLIALAKQCGARLVRPWDSDEVVDVQISPAQLEAIAAALSSATPAGEGRRALRDAILSAYKEHYDFPSQGESHMRDVIDTELEAFAATPAVEGLTDEQIVSQGRIFSTNNEYAHGRCVSLEFTPTGLVMLVRALAASPVPLSDTGVVTQIIANVIDKDSCESCVIDKDDTGAQETKQEALKRIMTPDQYQRAISALASPPPQSAPQEAECLGDPGECAYNGACMYHCGRLDPPPQPQEAEPLKWRQSTGGYIFLNADGSTLNPVETPVYASAPQPEAWVNWKGTDTSYNSPVRVSLRFRDGVEAHDCDPKDFSWRDRGEPDDIVAYSVTQEADKAHEHEYVTRTDGSKRCIDCGDVKEAGKACATCGGRGYIVLASSRGEDEQEACPECNPQPSKEASKVDSNG